MFFYLNANFQQRTPENMLLYLLAAQQHYMQLRTYVNIYLCVAQKCYIASIYAET